MRLLIPERICLIIPSSAFLLDERVFMSLGILKVAAVLEKAGIKVEMLDLSGVQNSIEAVVDHTKTSKTEIFGITSTTPQLPAATKISEAIRQTKPSARIIIGGPHPTLVNTALKREKRLNVDGRATKAMRRLEEFFDVIIAGDGEEAIFQAIQKNAPMLIDADDPQSLLFLNQQHLNNLPFPARHLIDAPSYHYSIEGFSAISLIAQLGCPYACGFCGGRESPTFRRVRIRTSENVVDEMIHLYRTDGYRGFMLYDDELNVNTQMIELMALIAKAQKDLGAEWRLRGFIKAQLFTDAQAEAMHQAGFRWVLTGFESGSPRILQNMNKKATREENTRCVEIAKRHGLKVKALMSIGHPGESFEKIQDTYNWLLEIKPDDFDVSIITCYPGTPYYDYALPHKSVPGVWTYTYEKTGDRLHQIEIDYTETANYYKGNPDGGYRSYVFTDELKSDDLVRERNRLERTIRKTLAIPFNPSASGIRYEHSMGQFGKQLPQNILKITQG